MIILIKAILTACLITTFIQDLKYRGVWWFIFPIVISLMGTLHYLQTSNEMIFYLNCIINISMLCLMLFISLFYFKMRYQHIHIFGLIGLGDILFFLGLALGFPFVSFVLILTTCLILSLAIHLTLRKGNSQTVPLAGYAALTLLLFYAADWLELVNNLYIL